MYKNKTTLALVDDHPIVIEGLKALFKEHSETYNLLCFSEGQSIVNFLKQNRVDVVLLDISLPDINGIDICKIIKTNYPEIFVIGLSNQAEQSTIMQMLENGASGFLLKNTPAQNILDSIEDALYGKIVLSKEVTKILQASPESTKLPSLTKREKQILRLLAQGKTTTAVAEELFLSRFTIETYRKNLLQKFETKNTTELLMLLVREKLL